MLPRIGFLPRATLKYHLKAGRGPPPTIIGHFAAAGFVRFPDLTRAGMTNGAGNHFVRKLDSRVIPPLSGTWLLPGTFGTVASRAVGGGSCQFVCASESAAMGRQVDKRPRAEAAGGAAGGRPPVKKFCGGMCTLGSRFCGTAAAEGGRGASGAQAKMVVEYKVSDYVRLLAQLATERARASRTPDARSARRGAGIRAAGPA